MLLTVAELQEWSDYGTIQNMSKAKLEDAILLAETRLGVFLCDPDLEQFRDEDGEIKLPAIIKLTLKKLAEVYAFDMSEDSKAITGFMSESMGNYSYSKGNVGAVVAKVFQSMSDMLGQYSLCTVMVGSAGQKFRMRRV